MIDIQAQTDYYKSKTYELRLIRYEIGLDILKPNPNGGSIITEESIKRVLEFVKEWPPRQHFAPFIPDVPSFASGAVVDMSDYVPIVLDDSERII